MIGTIAGVVLLVGGVIGAVLCVRAYLREGSLPAVSKRRDDNQHQKE